jgi:hypothetical protein
MKPEIYAFLASCSTRDLADIVQEILQPSHGGPLGASYHEDEHYRYWIEAMAPVERAYVAAYDDVQRAFEPWEVE